MSDHHALVIGASGIIGWSIVDQIRRSYPSKTSEPPFGKVTALVNRPLNVEDAFWPKDEPWSPKLELISGIDLLCESEEFERMLKEKVKDIKSVSHVYYCGELGVVFRI